VFPYVIGSDLYVASLARRLALGRLPDSFVHDVQILGNALALYHLRTIKTGDFVADRVIARIEMVARDFKAPIPNWLHEMQESSSGLVPGIRGFEVRNARKSNGRIWLFDPGRLRDEPPEADVARFLASLKILTWGTVYFMLPTESKVVERAFLSGYRERRSLDPMSLRLFLLRELSWSWTEYADVVKLRCRPGVAQRMVLAAYVHPGFRRHWRSFLADEQRNLLG